jgi:hypothetical protein
MTKYGFWIGGLWMALAIATSGCSQPAVDSHTHEEGHAHNEAPAGHTHGAWWCDAHGVPEEECALCDTKLAATFQKKGDWCAMHNRPDSQCFECHPELEAKFARRYEAKYGKKPPERKG